MPDRPASSQSGTGLKKLMMPEQVRYQTKLTQSGIFLVRYRTKIRDAGMPTPALVFWMPMPSYDHLWACSIGKVSPRWQDTGLCTSTMPQCTLPPLCAGSWRRTQPGWSLSPSTRSLFIDSGTSKLFALLKREGNLVVLTLTQGTLKTTGERPNKSFATAYHLPPSAGAKQKSACKSAVNMYRNHKK